MKCHLLTYAFSHRSVIYEATECLTYAIVFVLPQSHISETIEEVNAVKELFPESKSYTDVYHKHNLLTDKVRTPHAHTYTHVGTQAYKLACTHMHTCFPAR